MNSPKKVVRTNQALEVIRLSTDGMSIVKACQEAGIPRSTFYYFYSNNPELFAEFQEMIEANEREEYIAILTRRLVILAKIIQDALSDKTKPRQRLAAYKILMGRHEGLREKLVQDSMDSDEIKELLSGPTLIPGKSRFSTSQDAQRD